MNYFDDEGPSGSDNDEMIEIKDAKQPQEAEDNNSTDSSESKNIVIV